MPGVCSTSSRDELIRWLMPVAPQKGFRSWLESRSSTRKMSRVGILLPQIIFDTWWFWQHISQQLQMKECFRPLCCKWPLQCKMTTCSQIFKLSDTIPLLFIQLTLTENMQHFWNFFSFSGWSIKFIKFNKAMVPGKEVKLESNIC